MSARPWSNITDAMLLAMDEDEVWELAIAWTNYHVKLGCEQKPDSDEFVRHNAERCRPADRADPNLLGRFEKAGKACVDRGCWPDGATEWEHVPGCRFRPPITRKEDAERRIVDNVRIAEDRPIPENALKVLRTIADAGLGNEYGTPSIDVMAGRPWLCEQTGLRDGEVKAALAYLIRNAHIAPIQPEEIALRFKRRWALRGRKNGRPAQWYRILPPPPPPLEERPSGRLDELLAAAR